MGAFNVSAVRPLPTLQRPGNFRHYSRASAFNNSMARLLAAFPLSGCLKPKLPGRTQHLVAGLLVSAAATRWTSVCPRFFSLKMRPGCLRLLAALPLRALQNDRQPCCRVSGASGYLRTETEASVAPWDCRPALPRHDEQKNTRTPDFVFVLAWYGAKVPGDLQISCPRDCTSFKQEHLSLLPCMSSTLCRIKPHVIVCKNST